MWTQSFRVLAPLFPSVTRQDCGGSSRLEVCSPPSFKSVMRLRRKTKRDRFVGGQPSRGEHIGNVLTVVRNSPTSARFSLVAMATEDTHIPLGIRDNGEAEGWKNPFRVASPARALPSGLRSGTGSAAEALGGWSRLSARRHRLNLPSFVSGRRGWFPSSYCRALAEPLVNNNR